MKILVFGNVGAGKSTLIKELASFISFESIAIDDFRREVGDGSIEMEYVAREKFIKAIKDNNDQIIECLGLGEVANSVFLALSSTEEKIICIILKVPLLICISRLASREWDVPFYKPVGYVYELCERIDKEVNSGYLTERWSKLKNTSVFLYPNCNIPDLNLITNKILQIIKHSREDEQ